MLHPHRTLMSSPAARFRSRRAQENFLEVQSIWSKTSEGQLQHFVASRNEGSRKVDLGTAQLVKTIQVLGLRVLGEAPPTAMLRAGGMMDEWMVGWIPAEVKVQAAYEDIFHRWVDVNPHVSGFIDLD